MEGGICVNEWLMQEGYLALREQPTGDERLPFSRAKVDWPRTRAWGEGGYYCRLCLNVQGREPEGVVAPGDYEKLRDELIARLEALPGPDGQSIGTRAFRPEELWPVRNGIAPDLVVYFGNLSWRSVGSLGHGQVHTFENDTGPDDANHSAHGLFVMSGPRASSGRRDNLLIYDVAPTVLDLFKLPIPAAMRGQVVGLR
jgi:predicted AlkP superfamily phosphohydrolase/phosphomutase